jgi:predicted site-specific integrase-resolvase
MNMKTSIKLSDFAKRQGIAYLTAYRWFRAGRIEGSYVSSTGSIFVALPEESNNQESVVVYARVSNQSRRKELQYQVKRCLDFCSAKGLPVKDTYYEVASGMNDNRRKFWAMLESKPSVIVVENKDRLTRFGFNYLERLLKEQGCQIMVMNPNDNDEQDLMKDMVAIITSFCCRLYGLRRTKNKLDKIKAVVSEIADNGQS